MHLKIEKNITSSVSLSKNFKRIRMTIFKAINYKDLDEIKKYVEKDINVLTKKNKGGYTPLQVAFYSCNGDYSIVKYLVSKGANINNVKNKHNTPIPFLIIKKDNPDIIEFLIKHGLDLNLRDNNGYSLLEVAFFYQCHRVVSILQKYIDINKDIFVLLDKNMNNEVINLLNKDNVNSFKGRYSFIERILLNGNQEVLKHVLKYSHVNLNLLNEKSGYSLAMTLVQEGQEENLELFLKNGFNPNLKDKRNETPLLYAVKQKNINAIKTLIHYGARTINENINPYNNILMTDYSIINQSYESKRWDIIKIILESTNQNEIDYIEKYPSVFIYFIYKGLKKDLQYILKNNLEINFDKKDSEGNSIPFLLNKKGYTDLYLQMSNEKLILNKNEVSNTKNKNDENIAFSIVRGNYSIKRKQDIISSFINSGVNIHSINIYKQNILDIALNNFDHEMVEFLINKGLKPNEHTFSKERIKLCDKCDKNVDYGSLFHLIRNPVPKKQKTNLKKVKTITFYMDYFNIDLDIEIKFLRYGKKRKNDPSNGYDIYNLRTYLKSYLPFLLSHYEKQLINKKLNSNKTEHITPAKKRRI